VEARAADDSSLNIGSASAVLPGTSLSKQLSISSDALAYADQFPAGAVPLNL
jgi:hypothetical protein